MTALACAACSSGTAKTARPHPTTTHPTTSGRRPTTAAAAPHAYAVGKRTETFVDTTRPTPPNGTFAGAPSRSLLTTIYYPATGRPDAPVTADVPVDHVGGPFPLILFSHGVTARGILYEGLIKLWVRAGYVVAAPDYPLSNLRSPGGATIKDVGQQPADATFVINQVLALDTNAGGLDGIIDSHRIGDAGHSLGAVTTLGLSYSTCCSDTRIKAAVSMSGVAILGTSTFFETNNPPLLLLHGDADETVAYSGSVDAFRRAHAPKYFVTILGGKHSPAFGGFDESPASLVVDHSTLDFFDIYLKGRKSELAKLRTDAQVAGVSAFQEVAGG